MLKRQVSANVDGRGLHLLSRRPSAPLVISIVALVVAASGTAVAASKLVSGDSLIKKHSLSGNRLRNHTISGTQINLNKLGKVPSAANADHATTAGSATSATNATNATNATQLGGQAASAFEPASDHFRSGLVTASATSGGHTVPFMSFGPFTLTLTCTDHGGGSFTSSIDATSSEDKSDIFGTIASPAGTSENVDSRTNTTFDEVDDNLADFIAPSGKAYEMDYAAGVHGFGADCFAIGLTGVS